MSVSIGIGLPGLVFGRVSPASGAPQGGPQSSVYLTSIQDDQGNLLVCHAVMSANPVHKVALTKHPIEAGAPVTDHARPEAVQLTLDLVISNTPLLYDAFPRTVFNRGLAISSNTDADHPPGEAGYAEDAYAWLKDLCDNPRLVTVERQRATYGSMMVTSVTPKETAADGDALRCTVTMEEVIFATVKKVPGKVQLSKVQKKGKVNPKPSGPPPDLDPLRAITGSKPPLSSGP